MIYAKVLFRSTGSYEPDLNNWAVSIWKLRFRSTGSYEPDRFVVSRGKEPNGFDPQALTSLTLPPLLPLGTWCSFDPQALTSLTAGAVVAIVAICCFDPQALTSLTHA